MPTNLMRANAQPATPVSRLHNGNIVAIVLTAALVILQLAGLIMLERSHAHAMQVSFPREPASCAEGAAAPVPQIPYD